MCSPLSRAEKNVHFANAETQRLTESAHIFQRSPGVGRVGGVCLAFEAKKESRHPQGLMRLAQCLPFGDILNHERVA